GCGSAALTDSASVTLSLVIDASSLIRSYTDRSTVPVELGGEALRDVGGPGRLFDVVLQQEPGLGLVDQAVG
ncbi:hypothetical protein, partial [Streptomyces sp. NPDC000351]|uniref:hypothetical protein n=1 Tax=Streptomyces sp. NPDC000351 TaxID=3154250 RepID=UPI00332C19C9